MVGLQETIKGNPILVFAVPSGDYPKRMTEISSASSRVRSGICYVSLNKPYKTISSDLKRAGVSTDGFYFVDAVSSKVSSVKASERVVFVSSPRAMTELSISINKSIDLWKPEAVLFDSLSTLLVYEGASSVLRFVHSVISNIRVKGKSCIFTILKEDLSDELVKDLGMFVDKVEELER